MSLPNMGLPILVFRALSVAFLLFVVVLLILARVLVVARATKNPRPASRGFVEIGLYVRQASTAGRPGTLMVTLSRLN